MYEIIFYKNKRGKSEIEEYLQKLQKRKDKDSRIKANKIIAYINLLSKHSVNLGESYIKHLQNDIWELRPIRDRILFAYLKNNKIILLTIFMKQTQKTPREEIERAEKCLQEFLRGVD